MTLSPHSTITLCGWAEVYGGDSHQRPVEPDPDESDEAEIEIHPVTALNEATQHHFNEARREFGLVYACTKCACDQRLEEAYVV